MDSILSSCNNFFEQLTLSVLRKGKVPKHVGFILDGNRRYAKRAGATSTKFGHYEGFKQLEKVKTTTRTKAQDKDTHTRHRYWIYVCSWALRQ